MADKINLKDSKNNITKKLNKMHALDIANLLDDLNQKDKKHLINLIPLDLIDNVFLELDTVEMVDFIKSLDSSKRKFLLNELEASNLKPLFQSFDDEEKDKFIKKLSPEKQIKLKELMIYDETLAASIMSNNYITLNYDLKVHEAMDEIISKVKDTDLIDIIFILKDNMLYGELNLKDLIIARRNDRIIDIVETDIKTINDTENLSEAISIVSNYDIKVLAVVDNLNYLKGMIKADDVLDKIASDHESNIDKFVAVGDFDEDSSPLKRAYQRLPWLLVSIVLNLVIALFLSIFQSTIETVSALILFQPLILGMAGNIGTQAIAVTILRLHKDEHDSHEDHIKREIFIGLINSILIGIFGFVLSFLFLTFSSFTTANISLALLSLVIGLSLMFSMFLSAIFGVFIPLILTKFNIDPAAASGPVISTINDLVALLIYFGLATLIIIPLVI